jgi:ParB family chromosome partitioning protein
MAKEKTKKRKKMALGKGLGALIPDLEIMEDSIREYFQCDIDLIRPNRYQPRVKFAKEELEALSQSIKEQGLIQPLIVREIDDGYELAAGERRLRASKMAGLDRVPCVVKALSDARMLEISLVENIQRENLNPMEEAEAYHRMMSEFNLTQEAAAMRVGKSRSAVANFLRLRQLPDEIKRSIFDGVLSMGHARALLGLSNRSQMLNAWQSILSKALSVRETERLVNRIKKEKRGGQKRKATSEEIYLADVAENLSRFFGTKVQIKRFGKRGKVEIDFYSSDDLDRLLHLLDSGDV